MKNTLLAEIVRNNQENSETRQTAFSALSMSRSASMLPIFQNLFETMPTRDLKRFALRGVGRDNSDAAAASARSNSRSRLELGRHQKDEAIPVLIRVARNHPKMKVRKVEFQVLGQTGDQRAVAFFSELLSKD